jgi:hypothetical protein
VKAASALAGRCFSVEVCAVSRSSFFVGAGSSLRSGVGFRSVAGLAVSSGCGSWGLRSSGRSFTGAVLWASFSCPLFAAAFGRVASSRVGFPVAVRPGHCCRFGWVWVVSVPVLR